MWFCSHSQPRTRPCHLAPLCAGLLVPLLMSATVTAAHAQNARSAMLLVPTRSASNATEALAPRAEREQLAEAVMAPPAPKATQAEHAGDQYIESLFYEGVTLEVLAHLADKYRESDAPNRFSFFERLLEFGAVETNLRTPSTRAEEFSR